MERNITVTVFGHKVTVTYSEDSDEVLSGLSNADLREAAKQFILDTIYSVGEASPSAVVRVTAIS